MGMTLVVLAAGIGSRYGGLKQIEAVGPHGAIVIEYSVYDAIRAGFDRVVCVIRHDIEKDFRAIVTSRFEKQIPVDYVFQDMEDLPAGFSLPAGRKKPWGTGHAVLACRDVVKAPFAVINADDFYGRRSYEALGQFLKGVKPDAGDYSMVGFTLRNTLSEHGHVARGVCEVDKQGLLKRVVERGATVFLTSHVLEIVEKLCTQVGVIAKGKLVYQGSMAAVRESGSLEETFIKAVGGDDHESQKLSWLES